MSDKQLFILSHVQARQRAAQAVLEAPAGYAVRITPPTRSLEQNSALWGYLADISAQVVWHGRKLDSESWKAMFTASLKQYEVVPNLDNTGFVALGQSTSKMSKSEMSSLLELIQAFGAQHNVDWSL